MTESLNSIISSIFSINSNEINDKINLQDLDTWDSMNHMVLIAELEDAFNIQFTGDEIADIKSILDIKVILKAKGIDNL